VNQINPDIVPSRTAPDISALGGIDGRLYASATSTLLVFDK
jgi:hypothetical protein